jgi:hypothetical protein
MELPSPYMMIGGAVVFVILLATMGAMLGVIIRRTGC